MKLLLTLLLTLSSCGMQYYDNKPDSPDAPVESKPDPNKLVRGYLQDFKNEMEARGIDVDYSKVLVKVVDKLSGDLVGATYWNPTINKMESDLLSSVISRRLVYHEMGHALWHLPHSPYPEDIMYYRNDPMEVTSDKLDTMVKEIESWTDNNPNAKVALDLCR